MKSLITFLRAKPIDVLFLVMCIAGYFLTTPDKSSWLFAILGLIELARLLTQPPKSN